LQQFESNSHQALAELCADGALAGALHSYDYIHGLIFAVASAPEIPMPEQWLPWVIKQRGQLRDEQQADSLSDALMVLLQQQLKDMSDERITLPSEYNYAPNVAANSPVSQWFCGLLAGHSQLEDVWLDAWGKMGKQGDSEIFSLQKDLKHCLRLFSTFADIPLALEQAAEKDGEDKRTELEQMLPTIFLSLSRSLIIYVGLSGRLVDYLPNQFETFQK
jgi:uncharacterized protein